MKNSNIAVGERMFDRSDYSKKQGIMLFLIGGCSVFGIIFLALFLLVTNIEVVLIFLLLFFYGFIFLFLFALIAFCLPNILALIGMGILYFIDFFLNYKNNK